MAFIFPYLGTSLSPQPRLSTLYHLPGTPGHIFSTVCVVVPSDSIVPSIFFSLGRLLTLQSSGSNDQLLPVIGPPGRLGAQTRLNIVLVGNVDQSMHPWVHVRLQTRTGAPDDVAAPRAWFGARRLRAVVVAYLGRRLATRGLTHMRWGERVPPPLVFRLGCARACRANGGGLTSNAPC